MIKAMTGMAAAGLIGLMLLAAGCGSTDPARFYMLSSVTQMEGTPEPTVSNPRLGLAVGPITLPEYLDRPQIVTRISSNRLELAEYDKWAEDLADTFSRVLTENLSVMLAMDGIEVFPWKSPQKADYQLRVEVLTLDGVYGGQAHLSVRWTLRGEGDDPINILKKCSYREPIEGTTYEDLVAAQSRALLTFSKEVAQTVNAASKH